MTQRKKSGGQQVGLPQSQGQWRDGMLIGGLNSLPKPPWFEFVLPVIGPLEDAAHDFNHAHPWMGGTDLALAIVDGAAAKAPLSWMDRTLKDTARRGVEKQKALSWTRDAARKRHQAAGLIAKGEQEWHHAVIPHGGWGKHVPDQIKNASWNLKAVEKETHRRIHGVFQGAARFGPLERT